MKRGKKRKAPPHGHAKGGHAPVTDRRIIPIDDGPIRAGATRDCRKAMAKLESARAELRSFNEEDLPAYQRWLAATFGAFLTELRENARIIGEKQALVAEVEIEMVFSCHSNPRKAYAAVMKRRENPEEFKKENSARDDEPDSDFDEDDFDAFEENGDDISVEEREFLFDDFLMSEMDIDPDELSEREYTEMFTEYEKQVFGKRSQSPHSGIQDETEAGPAPAEARIKEIYRVLVRRLHPDLRADGDATVSAIWHDVQEAYEARNLDRLETLLALTEMDGTNGGKASLSQMRMALGELNRALKAIRRSIQEAKRQFAWGFSRTPYHGPIEKRIRREMEEDLASQRGLLADLDRLLNEWSQPWTPPARKSKKKPQAVPKGVQTEFVGF